MPGFLDFGEYPLGLNLAVFLAAVMGVWLMGVRLTRLAEAVAARTGLGDAFVGLVLLGGIVSLPELSTATTAALAGNAGFAVNTLLGGIAATMVTLAVVDALVPDAPISTDITDPVILLQGTLTVLFLLVAAAGITAGDVRFLGAGAWSTALLVLYLAFVRLIRHYGRPRAWVSEEDAARDRDGPKPSEEPRRLRRPPARLVLATAVMALGTAGAGILLSRTGDAIAQQTGLGSGFAGLLLGGIATLLPEVSTTYAAVRARQFELAFSDAYGSNLFSTMAVYVTDLAYPGGPVLNEVGRFGLFATLLGATVAPCSWQGVWNEGTGSSWDSGSIH